ncbi:MAG: TniB family NTP-binding protein [Rhizomicrobium sp.]
MTDISQTANQRAEPAQCQAADRQQKIKNIFVEHDRFREAWRAIQRTHHPVEGGAPDYGSISVLAGESRVGKTYVASRYAKEHPSFMAEGGMIFPVIRVDVPMEGRRGLLEAMAEALQVKYSLRINNPSLLGMVLKALRDHKVELLFFDEVQTVLNDDNRQMVSYMRHLLRKIANLGSLNIVCIGLEETYDFMNADPQLSGRGLTYTIVQPYSWANGEEQKVFRLLCDEFDRLLPFDARSGLGSPWTAHRLFYVTDGNIGRLKNFLFSAGCVAINEGTAAIEIGHFVTAYDRIKPRGIEFNPFVHDMSEAPKKEIMLPKISGAPRDIFKKKKRADVVA